MKADKSMMEPLWMNWPTLSGFPLFARGERPGGRDPFQQFLLRQKLCFTALHASQKLFAVDVAVLVPPFRFVRLGGERRHYAFVSGHWVGSAPVTLADEAVS
jgi:hypothetical protein